jgi:heptose-I-phosphate ethanolaminephosphotransferase
MYVLLETSSEELKEFSSSYFRAPILLVLIFMSLLFVWLKKIRIREKPQKTIIITSSVAFSIILILKFTGLIEYNAYHNIVRGTYGYYQLQNGFNLATDIVDDDIQIKSNNEILVIVLGESTTRGHMQLYNYHRETTPKLSTFKDSLLVYNDVISTDVLTLKAVPKMFTSLSNSNNITPNINIIDVFNKAGFKTFWLSNQRPISYHDNAISKIAASSNYFKFFSHKKEKHTTVLDDVILPEYNNILKEEGKKVIVIRLIGTHFDYNKRYPISFEKFITKNATEAERIINHYDNAVLYNDYIVFSILESLKKLNKKSALVYLSDHGENVYDNGEFFGRTEGNMTKSMFEIPFLVWTSTEFEFPNDFEYVPDRKFMTDYLYESLEHLFGVVHSKMMVDKSIFSTSYNERKRIVVTGINYDEYFLDNHE